MTPHDPLGSMPERDRPDEVLEELSLIRGGDTGFPVQLCSDGETGRLVLRAVNEGGFACVDIDLLDVVDWLSVIAPGAIDRDAIARRLSAREYSRGHTTGA